MRRPAWLPALLLLLAPLAGADPGALGLICHGSVCNFEATTTNGPANEVHVAVDANDPLHLVGVGKDYTLGPSSACGVTRVWLGYYTSFDGGATWLNGLAPGYPGGAPGPLTGYGCVSDPVAAIGGDGSVYISGLAISGPGGKRGVVVFQSLDGGKTFPIHGWAVEDTQLHDKNWLGVDPVTHRVYVTWTNFNQGIMANAASGGPTSAAAGKLEFAAPVCLGCGGSSVALANRALATLGLALNGQGTSIAIGLDSTVYVTWLLGNTVVLASSVTQGLTWLPPLPVMEVQPTSWGAGGTYRTPTLPQVVADRSSLLGNIYFVWQDQRHGDSDAMVAASSTRGLTWGEPVRINDDAVGNGKDQFFPSACVTPTGALMVGWHDRRDDPADYLLHFYGATSTDGGASFGSNQRLSTAASDPKWSKHQQGFTFIGDYTGTACAPDGSAYSIWADTRKGEADAMVARWT
jgi:hypothetical protein